MSYSPDPLHTRHVRLPHELSGLREILAEHVHDLWARQRIADGWVYGAQRDDQAKSHPCLVPYDQLPESEKEYDRETAVETLRAVLAHGYRIVPPASAVEPVVKTSQVERELAALRELVFADHGRDSRSLITCWRATAPDLRWNDLELCCRFIECLLEFQEPFVAFDSATEGLARWPHDRRLRQLQGMSLAHTGATLQANQVFRQLRDAGHADEETLGNLARTYKTLWSEARDPVARRSYLDAAHDAYVASYEQTQGIWSGINVAFLAMIRGDTDNARQMAARVRDQCTQALSADRPAGQDLYWVTAVLGEAALIRGERQEAVCWYARASAMAGRRHGNVASTCRQARALVHHLDFDWSQFAGCFPLPEVVVLSSAPWRIAPPPAMGPQTLPEILSRALRAELRPDRSLWGFSCLHGWWDVVFLEAVLEAGGEVTVLLEDDTTPLRNRFDAQWAPRAERLLEQCVAIHHLTIRAGAGGPTEQHYTDRILVGLGVMQARQLDTTPVVLSPRRGDEARTLEDSSPLAEPAGAGSVRVLPLDVAPEGLHSGQASSPHPSADTPAARDEAAAIAISHSRVMALLFADVRGFSGLDEAQLITFAHEFLRAVSALIQSSPHKPVTRHTWGDGLFFTFEQIADAGLFALDLADLISNSKWQQVGLPGDLSLRIGLHAGPVHEYFDPVSEQTTFCGVHVTHAARIEPVTPPGQVYASEAFAALASQENIRPFACEYVGRAPLAKGFGVLSMYHVRRARGPK